MDRKALAVQRRGKKLLMDCSQSGSWENGKYTPEVKDSSSTGRTASVEALCADLGSAVKAIATWPSGCGEDHEQCHQAPLAGFAGQWHVKEDGGRQQQEGVCARIR